LTFTDLNGTINFIKLTPLDLGPNFECFLSPNLASHLLFQRENAQKRKVLAYKAESKNHLTAHSSLNFDFYEKISKADRTCSEFVSASNGAFVLYKNEF
jgi:hypothetical protein